MSKYVLDDSAVVALLNREPGEDRVEPILAVSVISAVNYCEVIGKLIDAGMPESAARESADLLGVEVIGFSADLAHIAAALRPATKSLVLSLGDRSCLALGLTLHHSRSSPNSAGSRALRSRYWVMVVRACVR